MFCDQREGKPGSRIMTEEGTLEKECGAYTRLQLLTSFIGACLQATFEIHVWGQAVLELKRGLKWPSSQVVLRTPCWRAMSLKSSFASIAFLVSLSETCSGNRIPLLFYCAHERNRREVGVFWSQAPKHFTVFRKPCEVSSWYTSELHCVQCINSVLVLHLTHCLVEMVTFEPFVPGAPLSSLQQHVCRGNWSWHFMWIDNKLVVR